MAQKECPPEGQDRGDGPETIAAQLGPRLRAEFDQLLKSERKILAKLAKPDTAAAFAADPLAVLSALKIDVPPIIRQRLKSDPSGTGFSELTRPRTFRLPDGQSITARVNLRFTGTPTSPDKKG